MQKKSPAKRLGREDLKKARPLRGPRPLHFESIREPHCGSLKSQCKKKAQPKGWEEKILRRPARFAAQGRFTSSPYVSHTVAHSSPNAKKKPSQKAGKR